MAQVVKSPPAKQEMQETWIRSLESPGDPLEREMATYSSILVWESTWTEEPGSLQSMGSQRDKSGHARIHSRGFFKYV